MFWLLQILWRLGLFGWKIMNDPNSRLSATKLFLLFVDHILKSLVLPADRFCFCTVPRVDKTKAQLCRFRLEGTRWPTQQVSQHLVLSHLRHSPSDQHRLVLLLEMVSWQCQQTPELRISPLICFFLFLFFILNASVSLVSSCLKPLCNGDFPKRAFPLNYSPSPSSRGRWSCFVQEVWHVNSLHTLLFHF